MIDCPMWTIIDLLVELVDYIEKQLESKGPNGMAFMSYVLVIINTLKLN